MYALPKNWSSLSLKSKGPQTDNTYITTSSIAYKNDLRVEQYGNRKWNIGDSHWQPESVDLPVIKEPMMYGVLESKIAREKKLAEEIRLANQPGSTTYRTSFVGNKPIYPRNNLTKNRGKIATNMYGINKWHKDLVLRNQRLVNVFPDA